MANGKWREQITRDNDATIASMRREAEEGNTCGGPHRSLEGAVSRSIRNQEALAGGIEEIGEQLSTLLSAPPGKSPGGNSSSSNGSTVYRGGASIKLLKGWIDIRGENVRDVIRILAAVALIYIAWSMLTDRREQTRREAERSEDAPRVAALGS